MKIRHATAADWPAMSALLGAAGLKLDGLRYDAFSPPCLVLEHGAEVIGMIQAHPGAPYAVITEMAIAREYQDQGHGAVLLSAMEDLLRALGVQAWVGVVGRDRSALEKLEHYGARPTGEGVAFVRNLSVV